MNIQMSDEYFDEHYMKIYMNIYMYIEIIKISDLCTGI